METDQIEEMDVEVLSSMWPEDVGTEADKQFNVEKPAIDLDMLKEVTIEEKPTIADLTRLPELLSLTQQGSSQLTNLVKQWEYMQNNAVRLLREELKNLDRQREEAEAKELKIIEEYNFESHQPEYVSVLDETSDLFRRFRQKKRDALVDSKKIEIYEEFDSKKVDDEENSETVATTTDMNEAVNVEESKEEEKEEAEVKEEEGESSAAKEETTETMAQVEELPEEGTKNEVVQGKKESPTAYNDVIASKMQENPRKNKVLALAGAFQTVIDYETAASK